MSPGDAPAPLAWVEVSPGRLQHNIRMVISHVSPAAAVLACVKADGYGHGLIASANAFLAGGAFMLGVATLTEGMALRQNGVTDPVLVFNGILPEDAAACVKYRLTANIVRMESARALSAAAADKVPVHINIDTGMGRNGIDAVSAPGFIDAVAALDGLDVQGIYTHFPESEGPDLSFAEEQIRRFTVIHAELLRRGHSFRWVHCANSGAVMNLPSSYAPPFNLIRPGIMLYGLSPLPGAFCSLPVQPALSVKARLMQVKKVPAGTPVGYGRAYVTPGEETLAVVPIGYGDGYFRFNSNQRAITVNGIACPVRGRISMDQTVIDVSGVPDVKPGDTVVVYSDDPHAVNAVDRLTKKVKSISYELTCLLGRRLPRVYL